jgi:hypothetical protein
MLLVLDSVDEAIRFEPISKSFEQHHDQCRLQEPISLIHNIPSKSVVCSSLN